MSDRVELFKEWPSKAGGVPLFLYRKENPGATPVLLIHGASARHETFTFPPSLPDLERNLVDWLHAKGFDPWLLDWRGGARVVEAARKDGTLERAWETFDLDYAAEHDLPEALEILDKESGAPEHIGLVGHCLGAAILAQAIAQGFIAPKARRTLGVVLQTIGLFYQAKPESQFKSHDRVLERLLAQSPRPLEIDPRRGDQWPREMSELYDNMPGVQPHPHAGSGPLEPTEELCNRASFMYGQPYLEENLVPAVHCATAELSFRLGRIEPAIGDVVRGASSDASGVVDDVLASVGLWEKGDREGVLVTNRVQGSFQPDEDLKIAGTRVATCAGVRDAEPDLAHQFGGIPLRLYAHGGRNLRRGWAAGYGASEYDRKLLSSDARERFHALERLLLLTGQNNPLWHRASIDQMYDWLFQGSKRPGERFRKCVLPGYGHQDLLWGRRASEEVFPLIHWALETGSGGNHSLVSGI